MKKLLYVNVLLTALLFCHCTTSRITGRWKNTDVHVAGYKKILVIALIRNADSSMQQRLELHMAGDITRLGYEAVSSYKTYGPAPFRGLDEKTVVSKLRNSGIDGILTIVLLDKSKDTYDIMGKIISSMYPYNENAFWDYYSAMYNHVSTPGSYQEHTTWYWESNLYDGASQTRIYSVQTSSFDPSSSEQLSHQYGKMIVKDMVKNKVLLSH